jgi:hypothetical protein
MMKYIPSYLIALATLMGLSGAASWALAQDDEGDSGDIRLEVSKDDKPDTADLSTLSALKDGRSQVSEKDRPVLNKTARWLIYRLTWVEYQEKKYQEGAYLESNRMTMNELVQQAYSFIPVPDPRKKNPSLAPDQIRFMEEFSRPLVVHIKKVLQNPRWIARVNAAMILARIGECSVEEVADAYREILEDKKQIDAVKYYALIGLKNQFKASAFQDQGFKNKEREARCALALIDYLKHKPSFSPDSGRDEVEGFRYVRREAVRALGLSRLPGVLKDKEIAGRPALELLRVVRKDGLTPEPSLSEQVEAVIALSELQTKLFPDSKFYAAYEADYAVYHVAQFVVEFAGHYAERNRPGQVTTPWKLQSARLAQALRSWQDDLLSYKYKFNADRAKYVSDMLGRCLSVIERIENTTPADPNKLRDALRTNLPKGAELFAGMPDSTIKSPLPSEAL